MALHRKGQVPGYKETFNAMSEQGWSVETARFRMHGEDPVIYVDAATPFTYGGEPVKARCWTGTDLGERKGMDVMLFVERDGQPCNVEDLYERENGTRNFVVDRGGDSVAIEDSVGEASRFAGAASHYPFVCSLEDYKLLYGKKADAIRRLGGTPDPEKGYETYLEHCVKDLESGNTTYIGAVRTPRAVQSLLDEHRIYMDEKDGPVHGDLDGDRALPDEEQYGG